MAGQINSGGARLERESETVHAIALAGWRRAVGKDMAEMAAALRTVDARTNHAERAVLLDPNRIVERGPEARPAGAAVELGIGREKRELTTGTDEGAGAMFVVQRTGVGALGAGLAQHGILGRRQAGAPLGVGQ